MHEIPELDQKGLRDFGLTTGAIVAVLFGLLFPWLFSFGYPLWPWIIFAILTVWAFAAPESLRLVYKKWMQLGMLIGKVVNPIVLGVVFFLVFFPFGIVMRTFSRDPMRRRQDAEAPSYRVPSSGGTKRMDRPF